MRELIQTILGFVAVLLPFLVLLLRRRSTASRSDQQRGPLTGRPDSELLEQTVTRDALTDTDDPMLWLRRVARQREESSLQQSTRPGESGSGHTSEPELPQREPLARQRLEGQLASSSEQDNMLLASHTVWRRILRLSPLQRAIVLGELIGPPKAYSIHGDTRNAMG